MSFAFMPFYTGDYHRDTRHLTPEEHGIYILLLIHCWDQKGPVPIDERRQSGIVNARSGGEIESLRRVLKEFFVLMDDGWYNERMTIEVARAEQVSSVRRKGGLEKARRYRQNVIAASHRAQAEHEQNTSITGAGTPTPTPTPTTTKTKAKTQARAARVPSGDLPEWLKPEDWQAYLDHRNKLRKPMTDEAQRRAIAELDKLRGHGNSAGAVIQQSLLRGWVGLFPVKDQPGSSADQASRVAALLFREPQSDGVIDG